MPASRTRSSTGSERAATSSGSSSRRAKNTGLGLTRVAGTRSHQARSGESPRLVFGCVEQHELSVARIRSPSSNRGIELARGRGDSLSRLRDGERTERGSAASAARRSRRRARRSARPRTGGEVLRGVWDRARDRLLRPYRRRRRPRRVPSVDSSRCSSQTSSASRQPPKAATPRRRASSSPGTSIRRTIVERYGGTVEKFIGDAVMAVWGTPVAQEDDAERAVRAALDLVVAIPELDPALSARAGVLTGEAAVTIGAEGQGMVAGDLVNTASRAQSAAEPGTVLVGEATKRASEAAIAYASAGAHELKGKAEPVPLWRALRVTAGRAGALKSAGLEPPFVGRERELRLVKELFHATADEHRATLVSVIGIAGIGKSRLGWEFLKYVDGLQEEVWWHRGRCLAYGEGVAFWALAEMVRMRARIARPRIPPPRPRSSATRVEQFVPDDEERRFVEPRLAHLLGLEDGSARGRGGALRRMASLLRAHGRARDSDASVRGLAVGRRGPRRVHRAPARVGAAASDLRLLPRPPGPEGRHPEFGHGSHQTTLSLAPLSEQAMRTLLDGFVPGLPRGRAGAHPGPLRGCPAVRRGDGSDAPRPRPPRGGGGRVPAHWRARRTRGPRDAARPHRRPPRRARPEERRILQDAAVLGKTFAKRVSRGGHGPAGNRPRSPPVRSRAEGGARRAGRPRAPERGQYRFLQDLVRRVAYETLARRERKTRHLAAAAQSRERPSARPSRRSSRSSRPTTSPRTKPSLTPTTPPGSEPGGAGSSRRGAGGLARRSGAKRVGTTSRRPTSPTALSSRGLCSRRRASWRATTATSRPPSEALHAALDLAERSGDPYAAARISGRIATVEAVAGPQRAQALTRLEDAFSKLSGEEPDAAVAELAGSLARAYAFAGDAERAMEPNEIALRLGQALRLPEPLHRALQTKAMLARVNGRPEEELAFLRHALRYALEHDLPARVAASAYGNLSDSCFQYDRYGEALDVLDRAHTLVRRMGDRTGERYLLAEKSYALTMAGRWDEALAAAARIGDVRFSAVVSVLSGPCELLVHRGELEEARIILESYAAIGDSTDVPDKSCHAAARAMLAYADGRPNEALEAGDEAISVRRVFGLGFQAVKQGFVWTAEAALALGDRDRVDELLRAVEEQPPGLRPPFLEAHAHRFRARMSGNPEGLKAAAGGFPRIRHPVLARGHAARARRVDRRRVAPDRGTRDLRGPRRDPVDGATRRRHGEARGGFRPSGSTPLQPPARRARRAGTARCTTPRPRRRPPASRPR